MKATDKPQISKRWWTSEKPQDIKGVELEKALQNAEKALADQKAKGDERSIDASVAALEQVCVAAEKTVKKEFDKKKHKDQIAVLERYEAVIQAEIKRLEDAKKKLAESANDGDEDDEDVDENKLFDKEYVYKMMKLLKSAKELRFSFGLNTNAPEASKLVLKRKGKPEQLFKILKKSGEFTSRVLTYGTALADPNDGKTLVFRLADGANEPPQIIKLGRAFLRADKGLRFRKLKLVLPGGRTVEDHEPDTDDVADAGVSSGDAAGGSDLSRELATVENLIERWQQTLRDVTIQIEKLRKALAVQSDATLRGVGDRLGDVMSQFPDLDLSKLVTAARSSDRTAYEQTLERTAEEIQSVQTLLADGPLLATIDENPFIKTTVHATVNQALERISKELNISA